MNAFPPPPPPKLGLIAWLRIALVLFLAVAAAVVALFFAGMFLILGLVVAAGFSVWATFKLRNSTIKGHYQAYEVRTHRGRQIIRGDYLEVEDSQLLDPEGDKRAKKTGKATKASKGKAADKASEAAGKRASGKSGGKAGDKGKARGFF